MTIFEVARAIIVAAKCQACMEISGFYDMMKYIKEIFENKILHLEKFSDLI